MIQLYVDDRLAFDSRLQDTALLGLKAQLGAEQRRSSYNNPTASTSFL